MGWKEKITGFFESKKPSTEKDEPFKPTDIQNEPTETIQKTVQPTDPQNLTAQENPSQKLPYTEEQAAEYARQAAELVKKHTAIPYLEFELTDSHPSIYESKVGGLPYLPGEPPMDHKGNPMRLLAQINCEDLKALEDYPHTGILQFWLTTEWEWNDTKLIYYAQIDHTLLEDDIVQKLNAAEWEHMDSFPVTGEHGLDFSLKTGSMGRDDTRLMALFCQYYTELSGDYISCPEDAGDGEFGETVYDVWERFSDNCDRYGNAVGGYPSITQLVDYISYGQDMSIDLTSPVLLFQLDSDMHSRNVMWGDLGIGHFLIEREDLLHLNFSNAWFYWDCS